MASPPARPVFLSYARSTHAGPAHALAERLGPETAFLDRSEIRGGEDFTARILHAVLGARVFVAFADARYFERWYCLKEWHLALTPYLEAIRHGSLPAERTGALRHVVLALPAPGGEAAAEDLLPPPLRRVHAHPADAAEELAKLVEERLAESPRTLAGRLDAAGLLARTREDFGGDEAIPPPRNTRGLRRYPDSLRPSRARGFVGRADETWQLHTALTPWGPPGEAAPPTAVLHAGGGFGKTQLAAEYLHRFGPSHYRGGCFWLRADVPDDEWEHQLHGALGAFREELPPIAAFEPGAVRRELHRELDAVPAGERILWVVDNLPEPPPGTPPPPLDTWCPALDKVTVLATSRLRPPWREARGLPIQVLDPEAAVDLLTREVAARGELPEEDWRTLAEQVGRLPLALDLLNRALSGEAISPRRLLERVSARGAVEALDEQREALRGQVPEDDLRGIAEAMAVSYELLDEEARRAARALAWIAPETFPGELLDAVTDACGGGATRTALYARSFVKDAFDDATGRRVGFEMHGLLGEFLRRAGDDPTSDWDIASRTLAELLTEEACRDPARRAALLACVAPARQLLDRRPRRNGVADDPEVEPDSRFEPLAQGLYALGDSAGESRALFAAVAHHRAALEERTRERVPLDWAMTQNNLANALAMLGERTGRAGPVEEAVAAYRAALEEYTRERVPLAWATTQNNLGAALAMLGERTGESGPLEEAVSAYRAALEERTRERVPLEWAMTENNLGIALQALGERTGESGPLEEAVSAYRAALEERTRERVPLAWATTQSNLGTALATLGERTGRVEPVEEAVSAYRAALEERTQERVPLDWAMTQNNLGAALATLGERTGRAEPVEEAVSAYRAALEERTRERVPLEWAMTQNNLGNALQTLGERTGESGPLEEAVSAYRAALEEYTRERVPLDWAGTQNNLGNALATLGERTGRVEPVEEAVSAYRAALEERTRERVPLDWAMTENNLGIALQALGERTGESGPLEEAVWAYRAALEERTRERVPLAWATTQSNLGTALATLGERTGRAEPVEEAVSAYRAALEERTQERVPLDWAMTQNNLGNALATLGERTGRAEPVEEAVSAYRAALEVFEKGSPYQAIARAGLERATAALERLSGSPDETERRPSRLRRWLGRLRGGRGGRSRS